ELRLAIKGKANLAPSSGDRVGFKKELFRGFLFSFSLFGFFTEFGAVSNQFAAIGVHKERFTISQHRCTGSLAVYTDTLGKFAVRLIKDMQITFEVCNCQVITKYLGSVKSTAQHLFIGPEHFTTIGIK